VSSTVLGENYIQEILNHFVRMIIFAQFEKKVCKMKHFLVEITYTVAMDVFAPIVPDHRAFLQTGYDKGWLLMSGPINPRIGGIVIARCPAVDDLRKFFRHDPYAVKGFANYHFVEFEPVKHQLFLENWVTQ
jgi:uncharacterized protein YciI